jgi:aminoglycoside 3-N-acetyltransferase
MYSRQELIAGFQQIPLTPSRVVMVHNSYKSLGGVQGGAETVIDALLDWVGPQGTVLFPNFNFQSWTENHYFDVQETPSHMGIIGELARLRPEAVRSPHPIYSFAVLGDRQDAFRACEDVEAYGPDSAFALFHQLNGMIISIGLQWNDTFSMIHYIEYHHSVAHRRIKKFSGIYVGYDGQPRLATYSMFVRRDNRIITDIVPAMDELFERGAIKAVQVGDATVHYATAEDCYQGLGTYAREAPEMLHKIKESSF